MLFWTLFIIVISLLLSKIRVKDNNNCTKNFLPIIATIFFIVAVSIFRYDVGWDYPNYYEAAKLPIDHVAVDKFEPLDKGIYYIAFFLEWPHSVFIIFGILTYSIVFYTLYRFSANFSLSVLTYIAFFYSTSIGPIRQGLAIAVILWGVRYLYELNYLKYFVVCIVAMLFHSSAIVAVIIPFIYHHFNLKYTILSIIGVIFLFKLILAPIAEALEYMSYLQEGVELKGGDLIRYLFPAIYIILLILGKARNFKNNQLLYVGAIGCVFPFILGGHIGGRVAYYFTIYLTLLIPQVFSLYNIQIRRIAAIGLISYFLLFIYTTTKNPMKTPFTPYKTIFSKDYELKKFKQEH